MQSRIDTNLPEGPFLLNDAGELFRPSGSPFRILDLSRPAPGSASSVADCIPASQVTTVDVLPASGVKPDLRASGGQLPFRDGTFDLVYSLDPALLDELLRVSRDGVFIAFPADAANWAGVISKIPYPSVELSGNGTSARTGFVISKCKRTEELELLGRAALHRGLTLEKEVRLLRKEVEALRTELDRLTTSLEGLQSHAPRTGLDANLRLEERMRQLELGMVRNKRAIQAIYDSRVWRALTGFGGLVLRLRGTPARRPYTVPSAQSGPRPQKVTPTDENTLLVCDHPADGGIVSGRDVVEIRGWALADSGIERVLIQIDNGQPVPATYGIPRWDVGKMHSQWAGSGYAGYRFFWDTAGLPEGLHTVTVIAVAKSGDCRELIRDVVVDWDSSPGYAAWISRHEPGPEEKRRMAAEAEKFAVRPRISIVVPVYRTPVSVLTQCMDSVTAQIYPDWELCLADDGSDDPELTAVLHNFAQRDPRIHVTTLPGNRGISAATNEALRLATGDYVAFLDHDDQLADFAVWEVVRAINSMPGTEIFYSDEDKIDENGNRYDAFFKPDWSPELFLACNYVCHFVVMKRALLDRLAGLNEQYEGSQDYEFLLRATELTQQIRRIPKILYHWRAIPGSAANDSADKPHASGAGKQALASYVARVVPGATVEEVKSCRYRVRYPIAGDPRVTVLVPTNGHKNLFRTAIEDVLDKTTYKNYEILLIDNSQDTRVERYAARMESRKAPVRYLDWRNQPFNFSAMNNEAVRRAGSPYVLFLNDDITVITPDWMAAMLEHAQRPEIGAVGAQLWYPNDRIQHAGVVMGLYGNCSHAFKNLPAGQPHYFDFSELVRNCTAVTAACLLLAREKFIEAGGFDEQNLAVAFQDVDLCLKLLDRGYRNVYTPYARLYHYESATKTEEEKIPHPSEDNFMKKKWAKYIADDPYYNPNLARRSEDFSISVD